MKFHNVSSNPQSLTGGGVLAVGESIDVKEPDEHLRSLVDAGLLIEVDQPEPPEKNRGGKE